MQKIRRRILPPKDIKPPEKYSIKSWEKWINRLSYVFFTIGIAFLGALLSNPSIWQFLLPFTIYFFILALICVVFIYSTFRKISIKEHIENIIKLWEKGLLHKNDLFIDITCKENVNEENYSALEFLKNWINSDEENLLVITGDYGCGKTTLVKKLAYELANSSDGLSRIPIVLELKRCTKTDQKTDFVNDYIVAGIKVKDKDFLEDCINARYLLIFDAFDEMLFEYDERDRNEIFNQINGLAHGKNKVIITCRSTYFAGNPNVFVLRENRNFIPSRIELQPFDNDQLDQYLEKYPFEHKSFKAKAKEIANSLINISYHPIHIEMIVKTLPKVSRIGMNIEDLYEYYINGVLEREDWGQLLVNERWNFCMNLAWLNLRTGTPDLDKKHIKTAAKSIRKNVHLKKLIRILKNTTLLTQRKTPSHGFQFSFIHSSFNDYLVARFLKMVFLEKIKFHYEDFDLDFLNNYISPETIVFLKNMVREKDIKKIVALKKMKKPQDVNIKKMSKIVGFFLTQIKFIDIIKSSVLLDLKYYPAPDKYIHKISNSLVERWSIKRKEIEKRLIKREKDSNIMIRPGFSLISFNIKGKKIFDIILVRAKRGALFITDSDPIRSAFIIVSTQDERLMYLHSIMWIAQIADDIDFESEWKEAKDEDKLRDIIISSFKKHYKFL